MATSINALEVPVSTVQSATAASYTVAADRYAIIRAQVKNGGSLNIGGITVLASNAWTVMNVNVSPRTVTGSLKGLSATMNNGGTVGTTTAAGVLTTVNADNGDTFANSTAMTSTFGTFKVPPGATIVGSGDARYHIELYRVPGSAT